MGISTVTVNSYVRRFTLSADDQILNLGSWSTGNFVNVIYTAPITPTRVGLDFKYGENVVFHCNPRYDERVRMEVGNSYLSTWVA